MSSATVTHIHWWCASTALLTYFIYYARMKLRRSILGCSKFGALIMNRKCQMSKGKGGGNSSSSRNNQKANIHNPNSPAHKAASGNRSNQMNPNNPAYNSSRQSNKK